MSSRRNPLPSQEVLLYHFNYDPLTGILSWKNPRARRTKVGQEILGVDSNGHRQCEIFGKKYMQHRVIWKMMTGEDPEDTVDHEDRDPTNNRWSNLRKATMKEQCANRVYRAIYRPAQNIIKKKNGYIVDIGNHYVGTHRFSELVETLEEAIEIRNKWGVELYGDRWRPLAIDKGGVA